jgi:hypothetical protein
LAIVQFGSIRIPVKELLEAIRLKHPSWLQREITRPRRNPALHSAVYAFLIDIVKFPIHDA